MRGQGRALPAMALAAMSLIPGAPNRIAWRGTITTAAGLTGSFRTRTHLFVSRDGETAEYRGRFRCRGPGCPLRHGHIGVVPAYGFPRPPSIDLVIFGARHPTTLNCYVDNQPHQPPNFDIQGKYTCDTVVPPEPPPVRRFSEGTLSLMRWARP